MKFRAIGLIAAVSALFAGSAWAQGYTAYKIGAAQGVTYSTANDINNLGQIVGSVYVNGSTVAFSTGQGGVGMSYLGDLGAGQTSANGINDRGQIVGSSSVMFHWGGANHAFILNPGDSKLTDLGTFGGDYSGAFAINIHGQVTGGASDYGGRSLGFITGPDGKGMVSIGIVPETIIPTVAITSTGQVAGNFNLDWDPNLPFRSHAFITGEDGNGRVDLGTLGGNLSTAYGMNDGGRVVGGSTNGTGLEHAFITGLNGAGMIDLGTLSSHMYATSRAYDINTAGQVVGWTDVGTGQATHAFVTGADGAGMTDLNSLVTLGAGVYLTKANGINEQGLIIAEGSDGFSYLLTPVPEPQSIALLLAGLCAVGVAVQRKKRQS